MIERVSYPTDLTQWDPADGQSFYLELFGETRPMLNTAYAEVLAAGGAVDGAPQTGSTPAPVYEYWWTIGHPGGVPVDHPRVQQWLGHPEKSIWSHLEENAAQVLMAFPLGKGWRIKELTATLKYLSPTKEQADIWKELGEVWSVMAPVLGAAGSIVGGLPGAQLPPAVAEDQINTKPLHTSADILDALGKLSINSVPASNTFKWSVAKMTQKIEAVPTQAVLWQIPRNVFTTLGGRVTGSLAVSFIPDKQQSGGVVSESPPALEQGDIACQVLILTKDGGEYHAPRGSDGNDYIKLAVEPQMPPTAPSK